MYARELSPVWLFAYPRTVACQALLLLGFFFNARIVEWVSISSSRGSTQSRDQSLVSCIVSCIGRWLPYCQATWEIPLTKINTIKIIPRWTTEKFLKNDKEILFKKQSEGRRGVKVTLVYKGTTITLMFYFLSLKAMQGTWKWNSIPQSIKWKIY